MKIAVLDDWQENAHEFADWSRVTRKHQLDIYHDTISGSALLSGCVNMMLYVRCASAPCFQQKCLPITKSKSHYYQRNAQCRD